MISETTRITTKMEKIVSQITLRKDCHVVLFLSFVEKAATLAFFERYFDISKCEEMTTALKAKVAAAYRLFKATKCTAPIKNLT